MALAKGKAHDAYEIVVIGASTGGIHALQAVLPAIPADFPCAIAIALHREKKSDDTLANMFRSCARLAAADAEDKELIVPGRIYLAPPDYHLMVERGNFALSIEQPVHHSRPSIDVLFESAAAAYGGKTIGVILTGASADGAQGLAALKRCGGLTIVQDPSTAEAAAMPAAAMAAVAVDKILPLERIGAFLIKSAGQKKQRVDR